MNAQAHDLHLPRHRPHSPLRLALGYTTGFRLRLALGSVLTLAGTAFSLAQPLIAQRILDRLARDQPIVTLLALLAGAVALGTVIAALGYFVVESVGESVVRTVRRLLAQRILRLRTPVFDDVEAGDLISRLVADTTLLRQVTTQAMVTSITATIGLLGSLVIMGLIDYMLLAVTLTAVVTMSVVVRWSAVRIGRASGKAQEAVGFMATLLDRDLGAFRTVKAAGAEQNEIDLLTAAADTAWRRGLRVAGWQAASGASTSLILQTSFLAVLGVGGARVTSGKLTLADLIAYLLYMFFLTQPVMALAGAWGQLKVGSAAIARVQAVLALAVEPAGTESSAPGPDRSRASVFFENVVFTYRPGLPTVHRGVTFAVPAGRMTAVVGPSGAGKTSLFALLERFYEIRSGRILVDGLDIREWPLADLRRAIGYVEQESPVLAGTLRENLTLGLAGISDGQLWEIVHLAQLGDVVQALPGGLDGWIGYRGGSLSGGQRQRIAIGRALLRRPRLLLLDEATSALDATNEAALRATIAAASEVTTVMVIAHRLSTVVEAGQILVMESGRVRACGTHRELLDFDPVYQELARTQLLIPT
ncbi:ABC-type multidrug transport system, ATPase and permease component [Parafrankia irregularis]|uniref:ABC-type multidrug transport system, ATPase and permease component n=1 Tax=Parafrankia irregularis TaxID=795642 RepID=A0A0S4QNK3_9ACTN|nr:MULTISPECIES: ABC transporter ATP-binding protein [Parafrankia]MBE3206079.1 ABC transporter ATP-binding protein [Parafrankia sp. CH37]CUU57037.1 ABC-type multidrug transport system, ATPase and permease component [Parafrankia irregularis]